MLLVASSRGSVEIDRDLSLKHVGPLALARLYGEFCMVHFRHFVSEMMRAIQLQKYLFGKYLCGSFLRYLLNLGKSIFLYLLELGKVSF